MKNKTIYSEVLSDSSGKKVTFYEMETGSSYYPENTDVDRTKRKRITRTLDELTKSHQLENALLKIDAQGAELDILDGSTTALNSVSAIYLETSLVEYNQDAPLAREVIEYLGDKGYMISDVGTRHRRDGQLIQIDLLFLDEELNVQEKWRSL